MNFGMPHLDDGTARAPKAPSNLPAWQRVTVQGLGFRVQGLGFRVQGLGFRVWGLGFTV